MEQYKKKMVCSFNHWYLDDMFQIKRAWQQRKYLAGYVGRFKREKGVLEMARAIHLILLENSDARFLMVGAGVLVPEVKKILEETNCLGAVDFTGQVAYEKMPEIFNDIKIHILPSIAEVSGAVNMEAMACGTIAIGNAVGGIPDIICDCKTGFLLVDNQPVTIATKVNEVLKRDDLDEIIQNAKSYVNENFSFGIAVERWTDILYRW
jgi:colanic acid/amylovoran biosynthesis glycosyltransferase